MKIFEVEAVTINNIVWYRPIRGFALFRHCSGNKPKVNGYEFENIVKPLLLLHGVEEVNVV